MDRSLPRGGVMNNTDDEDLASGSGTPPEVEVTTWKPDTTPMSTSDVTYASTYTASITILIVVSIIAIVVLLVFALATLRYRFGHKGSYYVAEFKKGKLRKSGSPQTTSDNVYEQPQTQEYMI